MNKFLSKVLYIQLIALSGEVFACSEPTKPDKLPDVETIVTAQMVKANNEVKAYVRAMEEYIGCHGMSRREKTIAYEELEAYAESFNKLVRQFKSRQG